MAKIYQIPTPIGPSSDIYPSMRYAVFGDSLSEVTTAGYLSNASNLDAYPIDSGDIIQAFYNYNLYTQTGDFGIFSVSVASNGSITLTQVGSGSGSGTVDSGLEGQLSYYAADGTTVEGLTSANNAVLVTDSSGMPSWQALGADQVALGRSGDAPFAATLTAGSNISIVSDDNAGTVTISAVGSGGSGTVNNGTTNQMAYYASNGDAVSGLATANNAVLVTNGSGVPSLSTTLPDMDIGTPTAGVLTNCSDLPLSGLSGASNSAVLVSNSSGVVSSVGALTNGQLIVGSTGATPVAAALTAGTGISVTNGAGSITIAATSTASGQVNSGLINQLSYYTATGTAVSGLTSANSAALVTSSTGVPSWSALTDGQIIIGNTGGTPTAATLTAGSNISITNGGGSITIAASGGSGSGTVNSGLQNQITYYAADGDAVSGLTSANSAVLVTNGSGVPSLATTLPDNLDLGTPSAVVLTNATDIPADQLTFGSNSSLVVSNASGVATVLGPMTDGQILIGSTGATPALATLTAGANVSISNAGGSITISASGGSSGGLTWNNVTGTSQAISVNNGYIISNAGSTTLSLPATSAIGDVIAVQGNGGTLWTITQGSGQIIRTNAGDTTTGTSGSMSSTQPFDVVYLICTVANTTWVYTGGFGNYNLV